MYLYRTAAIALISLSLVGKAAPAQSHIKPTPKISPNNATVQPSKSIYDISIRSEKDDSNYLENSNSSEFIATHPWAAFEPAPFVYRQDQTSAALTNKKPFIISGVNCDTTIQSSPTLTGVSWRDLSLRARGSADRGQFNFFAKKQPEWSGVGSSELRSSGDGFLKRQPDYLLGKADPESHRIKAHGAMQELLLSDNQGVRALGLTHQQIASPILKAIDGYIQNNTSIVDINGERFEISAQQMGGSVDIVRNIQRISQGSYDAASLQKDRRTQSGWIGRGVQGSPFNDELFSNKVYTLKRLHPKAGDPDTLTIDGLTPHLIHRYGFYQGGDYRTEPATIAKFFDLKPLADNQDEWNHCN